MECELIVQPRVMVSSGSAADTPAYKARLYVYYIDEKDAYDQNWRPASYADADAGLVRHRLSGEVRTHSLAGEQSEAEESADSYIHITVTRSPMLLVAVDPVNRFYAWRVFRYEIPLKQILVPVTFKTYMQQSYKEFEWTATSQTIEQQSPVGEE